MARIPFELAEPGTDPTRKAPPRPRRNLIRDNQWLLVGLMVFLAVGYVKFVRKPAPRAAADTRPTVAAPTPTPALEDGGFFTGDGGDTGFFPTAVPSSPLAFYGVLVEGENVACSCSLSGDLIVIEPDICNEHPVSPVCGGPNE